MTDILESLRRNVLSSMELQQYGTACYWGNKLVCLGKYQPRDVILYARVLYHNLQYQRAIALIMNRKELKDILICRYLVAQCHYACSEFKEALEILEPPDTTHSNQSQTNIHHIFSNSISKANEAPVSDIISDSIKPEPVPEELLTGFTSEKLYSSVALLKGKIHEGMENRALAVHFYKEALALDVTCYEAFDKLVTFQAMDPNIGMSLLNWLEFNTQLDPKMARLTEFLYKDKFEKYATSGDFIPEEFDELHNDVDVILNMASRLLDMCRFQECWEITSKVMQADPFNPYCLPIHISVLKELDKINELFEVAHKLMEVNPSGAVSWFAVGTYYACIHKNELARRHFVKSSQLDRRFGPTWLALGHAFAADGEHDQAIASYCTASQVIKGSHIPIMYIAIEYSASNNRHLAERFLTQAYLLRPNDPFVLHELGTLAFESQKYREAIDFLLRSHERACELSGQIPSSFWEPLINNMAHTYRKLGMYDKALSMHQAALRYVPDSPTTLAGIAMIYALTGKLDEAVNCLHRVIGLQPGSSGTSSISVAGTMLELCIDLLYGKPSKEAHKLGKEIPDSPPQKHLPPAGPGSLPGSNRIRFKKRSPDASNASKSSAHALHLDVLYKDHNIDHGDRSLDTSDEDVTMDLS